MFALVGLQIAEQISFNVLCLTTFVEVHADVWILERAQLNVHDYISVAILFLFRRKENKQIRRNSTMAWFTKIGFASRVDVMATDSGAILETRPNLFDPSLNREMSQAKGY